MKIEYVWTSDNLRLMGSHYAGKDTCVLEIHGMSGNFIENYYANILGQALSEAGYGFIYAHNRGYNHINDIATKPIKSEDNSFNYTRVGVVYELFTDCVKDIDAWIEQCRELGYKKIILMGHSLGCNKVIYYLSQKQPEDVVGIILTSPPDLVGLVESERYQPNYNELYQEAQSLVEGGKEKQLLTHTLWDWYNLSAGTFLSLFSGGGASDNLPIQRNPENFEQLATVKQPILTVYGEFDDIEITNLKDDMAVIKAKATSCPDFQIEMIRGANHNYENREDNLTQTIMKWVTR